VDEASSPYLGELYIVDNFVQRDLSIPLPPPEGKAFRHLILTGRNGCGKSATLKGLTDGRRGWHKFRRTAAWSEWFTETSAQRPCSLDARAKLPDGQFAELISHFPSRRQVQFTTPRGPTRQVVLDESAELEQILINWRTQVAYAAEADNRDVADDFRSQLSAFEKRLRDLLAPTSLSLVFDQPNIRYGVDFGRGPVNFDALPDGAKAALQLWLDIETASRAHPNGGVVLIDEPETHLHIGLQEKLLPFLAASFPNVQFVVATHSPAIAASLDNALIYDLSQQRGWRSEDLHGWRYGRVMTEVFGLDDEYSAAVTAELREVEHLRNLPTRTPEQQAQLNDLVRRLRSSSHAMAMELWLRMEHPEILADSRA
jgi:hypothetical protein